VEGGEKYVAVCLVAAGTTIAAALVIAVDAEVNAEMGVAIFTSSNGEVWLINDSGVRME